MIPDIKLNVRTMVLPSTGKKIKYFAMGTSVERELGRINNTYLDVFSNIAKDIENDDDAKKSIAEEMKDMTRDLVLALQPCFPELDLESITQGDLEMIQINLKRRCVDDMLDLQMKCPECGGDNKITVDLNDIEAKQVECERTIELDDGSQLIIKHIPLLTSIKNLDEDITEEKLAYDELVHSFYKLRLRIGRKFKDIDLTEMTYEDKIDWAFKRDNVKVEQREEIVDFLEDEKPGIESIELKISSCRNRIYNGKIVSMSDMNDITELDATNRAKAIEDGIDDYVSEISKIVRCEHEYSTIIHSLTKYMDFF